MAEAGRDGAPPMRASDADRERCVEALQAAATEGRLTFEELSDRMEAAMTAVSWDDLRGLVADLPQGTGDVRSAAPVGSYPASAGSALPEGVEAISAFGDIKRQGDWVVPAGSRWRTLFGDMVFDLRAARVAGGRVEIDASSVFGDIEILVPEGVRVEVHTNTWLGAVRQKTGHAGSPNTPVVVLTGTTLFGDVKVYSQRLSERIVGRLLGRR